MTAQRLQEDAREHAAREAELVMREARLAAEAVRQDAERALGREEETLRQVRARRAQLVHSFRRLLERELSELEVIEDTLQLGEGSDEQLRLLSTGSVPDPEGPYGVEEPEETEGELVGEDEHEDRPDGEAAAAVDRWEEEWNSAVGPEVDDEAARSEVAEGGEVTDRREAPEVDEGARPEAGPRAEDERRRRSPQEGDAPGAEDHDVEDDDWLSSLREGLERE
jgi:hypothetical protein